MNYHDRSPKKVCRARWSVWAALWIPRKHLLILLAFLVNFTSYLTFHGGLGLKPNLPNDRGEPIRSSSVQRSAGQPSHYRTRNVSNGLPLKWLPFVLHFMKTLFPVSFLDSRGLECYIPTVPTCHMPQTEIIMGKGMYFWLSKLPARLTRSRYSTEIHCT